MISHGDVCQLRAIPNTQCGFFARRMSKVGNAGISDLTAAGLLNSKTDP